MARDEECASECADSCLNPPARKIDINAATIFELTTIPGVDITMARTIAERRDAIGGFSGMEELIGVGGIWPSLLQRICEHAAIITPPRLGVSFEVSQAIPETTPEPPAPRIAPPTYLPPPPLPMAPSAPPAVRGPKSKTVAVLLGLFCCCGCGVHNFYLGYHGRGLAQLIIHIASFTMFGVSIVPIWVAFELILILAGQIKDAEGYELKA